LKSFFLGPKVSVLLPIVFLLSLGPAVVFAAPELEEVVTPDESVVGESSGDGNSIQVGLRMDAAYNAGGQSIQGFSLPSVRLTVWGQAADWIDYRFSVGQTREWSSALLPQLMPVEGFVDLKAVALSSAPDTFGAVLRVGLFTPAFNPWWSPDLTDLPLPDYQASHSLLFVGRDLGVELNFEPVPNRLSFFAGAFNGNGVFAQNTNGAKAFTAGIKGSFQFEESTLNVGLSGVLREQADPSSVNFRSDSLGSLYAVLESPHSSFKLGAELIFGSLNDSTRSASPFGGALTLFTPHFGLLKVFARAEWLRNTGNGNGTLKNFQAGPILHLHPSLQVFGLYQYLENGGSPETLVSARLRLVI
jgi:hypothetical protein